MRELPKALKEECESLIATIYKVFDGVTRERWGSVETSCEQMDAECHIMSADSIGSSLFILSNLSLMT